MAPALAIPPRDAFTGSSLPAAIDNHDAANGAPVDGPLAEAVRIFSRVAKRDDTSSGVLDPHDINNAGFFFLFALIGVAFVLGGIWFFFWAKNGGFHFKDDDWDDYKSTVLRRKGPNGTVLSGATRTTDLGGGSIYKEYDDDGTTTVTEATALSGITAGASDVLAREKRKKKQERREAERRKRRGEKKGRSGSSGGGGGGRDFEGEGVMDEKAEKAAREQLRSYRHERPARVGGLNKEAEGSEWEGSTNPAESSVGASTELLSDHRDRERDRDRDRDREESTVVSSAALPPAKTARSGGIRKVYSVADRNASREAERMRAEARRLREEGRAARRDFSYQRAAGALSNSALSESLLSGSGAGGSGSGSGSGSGATSAAPASTLDGTGTELGTKSYYHPMPELKEHRRKEREERRARRSKSGYRRGETGSEL